MCHMNECAIRGKHCTAKCSGKLHKEKPTLFEQLQVQLPPIHFHPCDDLLMIMPPISFCN